MQYLYQKIDTVEEMGFLSTERFSLIEDNLSPKFPIREYQVKAFSRFNYFWKGEFDGRQRPPFHLLYNMATGSGKTLVMAGLMLYLYENGYRNFLFFVNSNNIIKKTKDNFLNESSSKYLFNQKITINGKDVLVKEIENFDEADDTNINIKFVSIQMLTSGLLFNIRENGLSFEDFEGRDVVLIGDEAHHNNAEVWGQLVERIHQLNSKNVLLEFTATLDYDEPAIRNKYLDKVIFKYDLAQFRNDKFSKEINLVRSMYDEKQRIIQALILNLYRQELANSNHINLKPVILFKAKSTIAESERNKEEFHKIIDDFSVTDVEKIRATSTVDVVKSAFAFFFRSNISDGDVVTRIRGNFKEENCISANNDAEADQNQIRLNTLEDENNPIRAVFAVQKLNEGWDVLNLFDIVRLYEERDGKGNKPGKRTISEAQLIGRGARYFPFRLEEGQDKFTRKFDDDQMNDLKILEELYYHTIEDSRYITDLKNALVATGIYDDERDFEVKQLRLKDAFKTTEFYKSGHVVFNRRVAKNYKAITSFADLGVSKRNFQYELSSGFGKVTNALAFELETQFLEETRYPRDFRVSALPKNVLRYALSQNPFFYFDNLRRFFPNLESMSSFIESADYLGGLEITLSGTRSRIDNVLNEDFLSALNAMLAAVEAEIKANLVEYEGSNFVSEYVHKIFKDKEIRVKVGDEKAKGQEEIVSDKHWYVFNANFGTIEEKKFVELFSRRFEALSNTFTNIYLIRNERELKIFDKSGRAFEPDFLLFCKQKKGRNQTYQVFIEPKGRHLIGYDKWKEDFLRELAKEKAVVKIDADEFVITGVPFYNYNDENEFSKSLEHTLGEADDVT